MKRILWLIPLAVILFTGSKVMENNSAKDARNNSQVSKLWKDYEAARKADRPQKQLDILQEIKKIAAKERLPWDFYRAGQEFVDVSSYRNWKLRDSLYTRFQKDIEAFDEPVLTFFNSRHDLAGKSEFLKKNRDRMEKGRHTDFYEADDRLSSEIYKDVLTGQIPNDWEYALWSLVLGNRWNPGAVEEYADILEKTLGGRYPDAAFLEFTRIKWLRDDFRSKEKLEEYGSRVQLFPGVDGWFDRINEYGKERNVKVDHYIISSGLKEMIEGTSVAKAGAFEKIYASSFLYNERGVAVWPAQAVNFTNKTQFLFRISKGVLDVNDDKGVNEYFAPDEIRVPFRNIVYIGDSDTDIPCMKLVNLNGGHAIGVYDLNKQDKSKVYRMMEENRIKYFAPADYREGSEIDDLMKAIVDRTVSNEVLENIHYRNQKEIY